MKKSILKNRRKQQYGVSYINHHSELCLHHIFRQILVPDFGRNQTALPEGNLHSGDLETLCLVPER